MLRNTARGDGWNPIDGHGLLDVAGAAAVEEAAVDLVIRPDDIRVVPGNSAFPLPGREVTLEVTVHNEGVLDCSRAMVFLFEGEPGPGQGRQVGYRIVSVTGRESTVVEFTTVIEQGETTLVALADPFGHLPAAKRDRGEWYAAAQVTLPSS